MSTHYPAGMPDFSASQARPPLAVAPRRLRLRLLLVTVATLALSPLYILIPDRTLGTSVAGFLTIGMVVVGVQALILLSAGLWYDRACRRHFDDHSVLHPHVHVPLYAPGRGQ